MAMTKGYAINLSGGYHHASRKSGEGFCVYADITLAIQEVKKFANVTKTMIIDLDAHMGNGHERDFKNDPNCYIIDFFNPYIFPSDEYAREVKFNFLSFSMIFQGIDLEVHVKRSYDDNKYLALMQNKIPQALDQFKPQFVLYNAGTDCMVGDPLGGLSVIFFLRNLIDFS